MANVVVTHFDVHMVGPQFSCHDRTWFDTEAEALACARKQVGPNQTQATITAHTADHGQTFGIRHVLWEAGTVRDTGWSRWLRGMFTGGGEMGDVAFADQSKGAA